MLSTIFGNKFPVGLQNANSLQLSAYDLMAQGEEFIDLDYRYPIRISNSLKIECEATSPTSRITYLSRTQAIGKGCSLKFYIEETNVYGEYRVFWKVRNRGRIAKNKHMLRGEIRECKSINEASDFFGSHFVECYIVKNNICVAKDRISVNIMNSLAY